MTVSSTLRAAAQRVRIGWCQHTSSHGGNVCAVGAISYATADLTNYSAACEAVRQALDIDGVSDWNDAPERTQEEVALGLERAADYWDAQQTPAIVWTMREDVPA